MVIWSEELAIKNNGKWIPKEVTMSKQTAVRWLKQKLPSLFIDDNNGFYSKLFEEALQMEREQIKSTFMDAQVFEIMEYPITDVQYYEQTYGGQDE